MKKVIKNSNLPYRVFTCDQCETQYESNEYKTVKGASYSEGKYVDTTTLVDKCPECRNKVRIPA